MHRPWRHFYDWAKRIAPAELKAEICLDLARELGVRMMSARGENGELLGYTGDRALLERYIVKRRYAPGLVRAFERFFARHGGGSYLDIGANIGATLVPLARANRIACYGFEPEPGNFLLLERNVAANCPEAAVRLFNLALFDRDTEIEFELGADNLGDHRVRLGGRSAGSMGEAARKTIMVKGARLEALLDPDGLAKPIAAKIDIQGAEAQMYRGGRRLLRECAMLVMEFWPYGIKRMGEDPRALLELLAADFPLCRLQESQDSFSETPPIATARLPEMLAPILERAEPNDALDLELLREAD